MRLDQYLVTTKLVASRTRAQRLIREKKVAINGVVTTKTSYQVTDIDEVKLLEPDFKWASRGAFKLLKALEHFNINLKDKLALDVGASTGGFTEVMLEAQASHVSAIDVGQDQMVDHLRQDERVTVLEKTDIRQFKTDLKFGFVAIDVSFISLKLILPVLPELLVKGAEIVVLIKPQFEVGPENINSKGLVKDKNLYKPVMAEIKALSEDLGFEVKPMIDSPIKGGSGNQEFLMYGKWSGTKT